MAIIKTWSLPLFFSSLLLTVALLSNQHAVQFYNLMFSPLSVDPNWIDSHSTLISNYGHLVGFALLAVLCRVSTKLHWLQISASCFTLAAAIELAQLLTPQRQGRLDDFCLGVVGVVLGLLCIKLLHFVNAKCLK